MLINLYIYVTVIFAYNIYNYIKDLPFSYITQTNYGLCEKMNNTFCIRISYFIVAIVLYFPPSIMDLFELYKVLL